MPSPVVPYHSLCERLCVHLIWAFRNQKRFSKDSLLACKYLYNGRPGIKRWNVPWETLPPSKWRQNLLVQRYSRSHWKNLKFVRAEASGEGCGAAAPGPPSLVPFLLLPPCTAAPGPPSGLARGVRTSASNYFSAAVAGTELMGKPLVAAKRVLNKFAISQSPYWLQVSCIHVDTSQ